MVHSHKCATWFLSGLPSRLLLPSGLCTLVKGIKVLGVPLGSFSLRFSFLHDDLDDYVQHTNAFPKLGNV